MEADEQKEIRRRIVKIQQDSSLTPQEKGARMQLVLSGKWKDSQRSNSVKKEEELKQNIEPTFFDEENKVFGCRHYRKGCKVKAPCCGAFFTCRRCHDEEVDHKINRYQIEEMACFHCGAIQPIAQDCSKCSKSMARYFCPICKFFDDDDKKYIWHCDKCGLCRVGTPEMKHCDLCNMCLDPSHSEHRTYDGNCPICNESLFYSTHSTVRPEPCFHGIHQKCFKDYLKTNYKCPICSKTYGALDTASLWEAYDHDIESNPMPEEYRSWRTEILCNDCEIHTTARFHVTGHKCNKCGGYNTKITALHKYTRDQLIEIEGEEAADEADDEHNEGEAGEEEETEQEAEGAEEGQQGAGESQQGGGEQ